PGVPIATSWFLPTPAQWKAGQHWIRCDLHLAWDDPEGSLTEGLRGRYESLAAGDAGRSCDTPGQDGNVPVPCSDAHQWESVVHYTEVPGRRPDRKGDRGVWDPWLRRCQDDAHRYTGDPGPPGLQVDVWS